MTANLPKKSRTYIAQNPTNMLDHADLAVIYTEYITRAVNTDTKKSGGAKIEPMLPEEIIEWNKKREAIQKKAHPEKKITEESARSAMEQYTQKWLEDQADKLKDKEEDGPEL